MQHWHHRRPMSRYRTISEQRQTIRSAQPWLLYCWLDQIYSPLILSQCQDQSKISPISTRLISSRKFSSSLGRKPSTLPLCYDSMPASLLWNAIGLQYPRFGFGYIYPIFTKPWCITQLLWLFLNLWRRNCLHIGRED